MRINEVAGVSGGKLAALSQFLLSRAQDENVNKSFSIAGFLKLAQQMGVPLTVDQLKTLVQQPPLSNIIASVNGDEKTGKVVFRGAEDETSGQQPMNPDQAQSVVDKMAKRAASK